MRNCANSFRFLSSVQNNRDRKKVDLPESILIYGLFMFLKNETEEKQNKKHKISK